MKYINRELPIADVARAPDIRFDGLGKVHCWHPERHRISLLPEQVADSSLEHGNGITEFRHLHIDHEVVQDLPERRLRRLRWFLVLPLRHSFRVSPKQ
jgi:hypothetical protein